NAGSLWTPDGKRITFSSWERSRYDIVWKAADASGSIEHLGTRESIAIPQSWTPDGSTLAFIDVDNNRIVDFQVTGISVLSLSGDRQPRRLFESRFTAWAPAFSPDGHWLAYASFESGQSEVYVRPYPGPGAGQPISTGGGGGPAWSRNGRELFYVTPPSA